jgi:Flp pilus assembly protein TadB
MRLLIASARLSMAAALYAKPLPAFGISSRIRIPRISLKPKAESKMSFEEELQFVFNLKSQLCGGVNQQDALSFAISRAPERIFVNTRQALASQTNAMNGLHKDSIHNKSPMLKSCADLLELSSGTGSSINHALTQIAEKLMARRNQEQLIATELASTKATVFVLAGLPIMGAGMGLIIGTDSMSWLLVTAPGRICLVLGLGLELGGWLWIQRLLHRALADVA